MHSKEKILKQIGVVCDEKVNYWSLLFSICGRFQPQHKLTCRPFLLRDGCVSCCAGKKILLQKTGPCGRTCPWSAGSSVFLSLSVMPSMSRRAMLCITMATGHPTSSMFQQNRFRFVYLGQFRAALNKQSLQLSREISGSSLPTVHIQASTADNNTLPSCSG